MSVMNDNQITTINDLSDEVILKIFVFLYAYQLIMLKNVNKRFYSIINDYVLKYTFNEEYSDEMLKYVKTYWASIVRPLRELESHYSISDYVNSSAFYTSPLEDANQTVNRIKISKLSSDGTRYFLENTNFKECFRQFHLLLRPDILSYIILNMNNEFFNLVMNMSMSPRGTDGLYARLKNMHYSFEIFFFIFRSSDYICPT